MVVGISGWLLRFVWMEILLGEKLLGLVSMEKEMS
jgi:hypothetical protein